jgi:hypothetical protein
MTANYRVTEEALLALTPGANDRAAIGQLFFHDALTRTLAHKIDGAKR